MARQQGAGTVDFHVMDQESKKPLPGVKLSLWVNGKHDGDFVTDSRGACLLRLPEQDPSRLSVIASKPGFVTGRVFLRHETVADQAIPASYSLALHRATSIGGVVRDEQGRPIEGVEVGLWIGRPTAGREDFVLDEAKVKTDTQGRWHTGIIPSGVDLRDLHLSFQHPKFLGQSDPIGDNPVTPVDRLRDGTAVTVLKRGLVVEGRVIDTENQPLADARIRLGGRFNVSSRDQDRRNGTIPDRECRRGGQFNLTVQAAGKSPRQNR